MSAPVTNKIYASEILLQLFAVRIRDSLEATSIQGVRARHAGQKEHQYGTHGGSTTKWPRLTTLSAGACCTKGKWDARQRPTGDCRACRRCGRPCIAALRALQSSSPPERVRHQTQTD